jgi:hypothetical protein
VEAVAATPITISTVPLAAVAVVIGAEHQQDDIMAVNLLVQGHQGPAEQADHQMVEGTHLDMGDKMVWVE